MTTTIQTELLPSTRPDVNMRIVNLSDLPDNSELDSPPPDRNLIDSIRTFGVQQPIVVTLIVRDDRLDPDYGVIEGRRRIKAARQAGLDCIPATLVRQDDNVSGEALQALSVQLNAVRRDNPLADLRNLLDLAAELSRRGFAEEKIEKELARLTHMPRATIWRRMQLRMLISPFFAAVREGKVKVTIAERLAKMPREHQEAMYDVYRNTGKLTGLDLRAARASERQAASEQLPVFDSFDKVLSDALQDPQIRAEWDKQHAAESLAMLAVIDAARGVLLAPKGHDKSSGAKQKEALAQLAEAIKKLDGEA